jgi:hypothetical protein
MTYRFPRSWTRLPFGVFRDPVLGQSGRWLLYSALIGAVSGIGAIGFDLAFRALRWGLLQKIGRFLPPAAGAEGQGTDAVIDAFPRRRWKIRGRVPIAASAGFSAPSAATTS